MFELTAANINRVPLSRGIYQIYAKLNDEFITINRFCDIDISGKLYIGTTNRQTLRKRLNQFRLSSDENYNTYNHSGALKYKNRPIIKQTLGQNHILFFSYIEVENPNELEMQLLQQYAEQFGEYPPLNT